MKKLKVRVLVRNSKPVSSKVSLKLSGPKVVRSKSGKSGGSIRKVVDGLCYFSIYNPMIHNPTMHNSCINYLNTVGKLYFGK